MGFPEGVLKNSVGVQCLDPGGRLTTLSRLTDTILIAGGMVLIVVGFLEHFSCGM